MLLVKTLTTAFGGESEKMFTNVYVKYLLLVSAKKHNIYSKYKIWQRKKQKKFRIIIKK
jgi:hypothetical protein